MFIIIIKKYKRNTGMNIISFFNNLIKIYQIRNQMAKQSKRQKKGGFSIKKKKKTKKKTKKKKNP